jgi:hypothetical protein
VYTGRTGGAIVTDTKTPANEEAGITKKARASNQQRTNFRERIEFPPSDWSLASSRQPARGQADRIGFGTKSLPGTGNLYWVQTP